MSKNRKRRERELTHIVLANKYRTIVLTTDHSASSYGQPVAVVDGVAHGPNDVLPAIPDDSLPWLGPETAGITVRIMAHTMGISMLPIVRKFVD